MKKKIENYAIAVDMGTNSVGWAAIDEDYNLLKINGRDAWGVVLFENAKTAQDRRGFRCMRRRIERRRERIRLLQELFAPAMAELDQGFFIRLKESSYHRGEGRYMRANRYNLFEDKEYTDAHYLHEYPTIYHLRKRLVKDASEADLRLVYLALHHIIKYRGHFLNEGGASSSGGSPEAAAEELFALLASDEDGEESGSDLRYVGKTQEFVAALKNNKESRSKRCESACAALGQADNKKCVAAVAKAAVGLKFDLSDLLGRTEESERIKDENGKAVSLSFADGDFEGKRETWLDMCGDDAPVFEAAEKLYSALALDRVLRGRKLLCQAMTEKFAKHGRDLRVLRKLIRGIGDADIYNGFFRRSKGASYTGYVGDKRFGFYGAADRCIKTSREDLYKRVKELLTKYVPDGEDKQYVLDEMEREDFLPLITSKDNSYIPYQLNLKELDVILENQGKFHPCLAKNADKIRALLTFRRPYYVGTLKGKYSWTDGIDLPQQPLRPWNFREVMGEERMDKLAENFIVRMTNDCILIEGENALPLNSMLYQKYMTLNEINKIKIDEKPISVEQKQAIYALCLQRKSVKKTDIANLMIKKFGIQTSAEKVGGISDEKKLTANMSTHIDFVKMFGEEFVEKNFDACEEVVRVLTVFNDVDIRKKRIKALKVFAGLEEKLAKKNYSGWGKYSRKALFGTLGKGGKCILDLMFETNLHINEILWSEEYGFKEKFAREEEEIERFSYEKHVKDLRLSPVVRRSVWNALCLFEEIVKAAGGPPAHIYLENTAEVGEKKRTKSRYDKVSELYRQIKSGEYASDLKECKAVLGSHKDNKSALDSDKLYLWLTQLGRCMYSGERIDITDLGNCEIDHIVPRSAKAIADDSMENKALVLKKKNQAKGAALGMSPVVIREMRDFWEFLYKNKLIGSKKFGALQKTDYTPAELSGFANRQLNDTGYIVKTVTNLLKRRFPQAHVRGVKPKLGNIMRAKYAEQGYAGFYKIRNLNSFHHAKDAYLAAVLGQFTSVACPYWGQAEESRYLKGEIEKLYQKERTMSEEELSAKHKALVKRRFGFIIDLMEEFDNSLLAADEETGEVLWSEERLDNILRTMARNTCHVVMKKKYMAESAFYDQTKYSPKSGKKKLIPLKSAGGADLPTQLYGGYLYEKPAYFAVIRYKKKGKTVYAFDSVPVRVLIKGTDAVAEYIRREYGEDAEAVRRISKFQLIDYNGHLCYISGTMELQNAAEIFVKPEFEELLYLVEKGRLDVLKGEKSLRKDGNTCDYSAKISALLTHLSFVIRSKQPLYAKLADKLEEIRDKYLSEMTMEEKVKLIGDVMKVCSPGSGVINIDKKYGGEPFGRINRNIFPDQVEWIDKSVTGLFVRTQKGV